MTPVGAMEQFEALYRADGGRILLTLLRLSGSRADAEDLTQETFVRAWASWSSFRGESRASTWLHAIAMRVHADWRRSAYQRIQPRIDSDAMELVADIRALVPSVDSALEDAIARLPREMREAVVLHYLEDQSIASIATMLGKSVGTIKAQLHAGRARLRTLLEE